MPLLSEMFGPAEGPKQRSGSVLADLDYGALEGYKSAPQSGGGDGEPGGLSGILYDVVNNPVGQAVTTMLSALDLPRSILLSTAVEAHDIFFDEDGWENDDWASQAIGSQWGVGDEPSIGFGDLLEDTGLPHWAKVAGGFVGDVATDPLTYGTFGAGRLAGGAGKVAKSALSEGAQKAAREVPESALEAVSRELGEDAAAELDRAARVAVNTNRPLGGVKRSRLSRGMLYRDQILNLLHEPGIYSRIVERAGGKRTREVFDRVARQHSAAPLRDLPEANQVLEEVLGTGLRHGLSVGVGRGRIFLGGEKLADDVGRFMSGLKDKTVRKWITTDPKWETFPGVRAIKKSDSPTPYYDAYLEVRTRRGANMDKIEFRSRMDDALNAARRVYGGLEDADEDIIQRVETQTIDALRGSDDPIDQAAAAVKEFLEEGATRYEQITGEALPRLNGEYFPRQWADDLKAALDEGNRQWTPRRKQGPMAQAMERKYTKGANFLGVELQEGTMEEIHRVARNVIGEDYVQVFDNRVDAVLRKYAHDMSNAVLWRSMDKHARLNGIRSNFTDESNKFIRENTRGEIDELRKHDLAKRQGGVSEANAAVREASNERILAEGRLRNARRIADVEASADEKITTDLKDDIGRAASRVAADTDVEGVTDQALKDAVLDFEDRVVGAMDDVSAGTSSKDIADAVRLREEEIRRIADEQILAQEAQGLAKSELRAANKRVGEAKRALAEVTRMADEAAATEARWKRRQLEAAASRNPEVVKAESDLRKVEEALEARRPDYEAAAARLRETEGQLDGLLDYRGRITDQAAYDEIAVSARAADIRKTKIENEIKHLMKLQRVASDKVQQAGGDPSRRLPDPKPPGGAAQWRAAQDMGVEDVGRLTAELEEPERRVFRSIKRAQDASESQLRRVELESEIAELRDQLADIDAQKDIVAQRRLRDLEEAKRLREAAEREAAAAPEEGRDVLAVVARLEAELLEAEEVLKRTQSEAQVVFGEYQGKADWYRKLEQNADALYDEMDRGFRDLGDGQWGNPWTHEAYQQMRELQARMPPNKILRMYDGLTARWKAWALVSPGYHARNGLGGYINNLLDSVKHTSYHKYHKSYKQFRRRLRKNGGYRKGKASLYEALKGIEDKQMRDIFEEMLDGADFLTPHGDVLTNNVRDASDVAELWSRGGRRGPVSRFFPEKEIARKLDPFDMENALLDVNFMGAGGVERILRATQYIDNRLRGETIENAWDKIRRFHFDYGELSQMEIEWARRIVPFYTWTRKNFPLQLEMIFRKPAIYQGTQHLQRNLALGVEDDEMVPSYYGPLGASLTPFVVEPGSFIPKFQLEQADPDEAGRIHLTPDTPFRDLAQVAEPKGLLGMLNPILKTPLEVSHGAPFFTDIPFSDYLVEAPDYGPGTGPFYEVLSRLDGSWGLPRVEKIDGVWMWRAVDQHKVESTLPMLGRTHRVSGLLPWAEGKETYQNRSLQYTLSTLFGISTQTNDATAQWGVQKSRDDALEKEVARARGEAL